VRILGLWGLSLLPMVISIFILNGYIAPSRTPSPHILSCHIEGRAVSKEECVIATAHIRGIWRALLVSNRHIVILLAGLKATNRVASRVWSCLLLDFFIYGHFKVRRIDSTSLNPRAVVSDACRPRSSAFMWAVVDWEMSLRLWLVISSRPMTE